VDRRRQVTDWEMFVERGISSNSQSSPARTRRVRQLELAAFASKGATRRAVGWSNEAIASIPLAGLIRRNRPDGFAETGVLHVVPQIVLMHPFDVPVRGSNIAALVMARQYQWVPGTVIIGHASLTTPSQPRR